MEIGTIELKIENLTVDETEKYKEIFSVLAASGTLKLKNVGIVLHIDGNGIFQGLELDNYWPWRRKDLNKSW